MGHMPLLWIDIETSGLSPHEHYMLEYALALTDGDLNILDLLHVVIGWRDVRALLMAPEAREMHERNGLLDEVEASPICMREAEDIGVSWVRRHSAAGLYMAGSGPQFDRGWMSAQMPSLARLWHRRNVDMTTLRYFLGETKPDSIHRAVDDVRSNIADMRRYVNRAKLHGLLALPGLSATG